MEFLNNKGKVRTGSDTDIMQLFQVAVKDNSVRRASFLQFPTSTSTRLEIYPEDELCVSLSATSKEVNLIFNPDFDVETFPMIGSRTTKDNRLIQVRNKALVTDIINYLGLSDKANYTFEIELSDISYKRNKVYKLKMID